MSNLYLSGVQTERADFELRVKKIASMLIQQGVRPGEAIALLMRNDVVYFELIEACRYVEAHYVPLNWHSTASEIGHILTDSGAKILIGHHDLMIKMAGHTFSGVQYIRLPTPLVITEKYHLKPVGQDQCGDELLDFDALVDNAKPITTAPQKFRGMFPYTSGSTGRPKGIKRQHTDDKPDTYDVYKSLAKNLMGLGLHDRFYITAPLYHSAPNALSMCCLADGGVDIYIEPKFHAERFLEDIERYRITHTYMVPTMMVRLLKLPEAVRNKFDVSSLRFAISSGSAWPADLKHAMIDWFGPIFFESYGASEIGFMTLISSVEAANKPGSVGKVLSGGSIKILNDQQQPVAPGVSGSIYVYLPQFGPFSYTNADGDLTNLHWQGHTCVGDVGYLDDEDYLYINDRKKDMIISGGANIFPAEIEAAIINMPEVYDCAVFGAPHPEFGETIVVAVHCQDNQTVTLDEIHAYLKDKLARFKFPRKLDIHNALPREDSGKIFKQRLRAAYE